MAVPVKSAEASAQKWQERAAGAANLMAEGALAAAGKWAQNTAAAGDNYHQAITSGNVKQRFMAGVRKAGAEKYGRAIQSKAATRYSQGVGEASGDYSAGVAPYLQTIASLNLSQRKPRGDPSNYQRVAEVGRALHNKRIAQMAGGG